MAKTILITDDEPGVVKILEMKLKANGYHVIVAYDGAQAIKLTRRKKPDLIILDIKMPGRDGYSVFEDLKTSAETMSIPIVFFSVLLPELAQKKATQLGADGFVSKSADPDEILIKVTEILDQSKSQLV